MRNLVPRLRAWLHDESGQDLTEYGLLAVLIAVVVVTALTDVGAEVDSFWDYIADRFSETASTPES